MTDETYEVSKPCKHNADFRVDDACGNEDLIVIKFDFLVFDVAHLENNSEHNKVAMNKFFFCDALMASHVPLL